MVELKSLVPRAIAYGMAEVIKPKMTPATTPVSSDAHGLGLKNPQHEADEDTEPRAGDHAATEDLRPGQPLGDALDLHQVDADDRHVLHRELLVDRKSTAFCASA